MESPKKVLVTLLFYHIIPVIYSRGGSQITCKQIWSDEIPKKEFVFDMHENSTENDIISMSNWRWTTNLNEKWSVYYKEWPSQEIYTGGFIIKSERFVLAKLNWKVRNNKLIWTTTYRIPFISIWNVTTCNSNIPFKMNSSKKGWIFLLGDISLVGGKSGIKDLTNTSLLAKLKPVKTHKINKREVEDMAGDEEKKTVFNKIKGWFKELFDKSEGDQRTVLIRLKDWMLGFLERILS